MRRSFLVISALALAACDPAPPGGAASASATASAAPPPASTPAPSPPPPPPDNLDVGSLQKSLKCASDAKSGACGVLARFPSCTPWNAVTPGGDARWLGRGTAVEGGKTRDAVVVVRSRRVPLAEVAPGQIGARVGIGEITRDDGSAFDQADRAVRAYERNDVPPKSSATLEYLKKRTDWTEAYASQTAGGQTYATGGAGSYLCTGPKHELLLVQRTGKASSADGLYAELWAVTW